MWPIFVLFHCLIQKWTAEGGIRIITPQTCCCSTLQKVQPLNFTLARIICFMSGGICFTSFYLLIYFYFVTLTLLWHHCNILFVAFVTPLNYEDKRLGQHWWIQRTIDISIDQWNAWLKVCKCAHCRHYEHNYICCKLICTDQKELASLVDVTVIKCLHHFDLNKLCCEVIE